MGKANIKVVFGGFQLCNGFEMPPRVLQKLLSSILGLLLCQKLAPLFYLIFLHSKIKTDIVKSKTIEALVRI